METTSTDRFIAYMEYKWFVQSCGGIPVSFELYLKNILEYDLKGTVPGYWKSQEEYNGSSFIYPNRQHQII